MIKRRMNNRRGVKPMWRYIAQCEICLKHFFTNRKHTKYCGAACRKSASRQALQNTSVPDYDAYHE